ncbi:MAG TPA: hypothetical protein VN038_01495 [Dyadobacter sp.]|nr:hypothetical protein [Dyadobacter sp.]
MKTIICLVLSLSTICGSIAFAQKSSPFKSAHTDGIDLFIHIPNSKVIQVELEKHVDTYEVEYKNRVYKVLVVRNLNKMTIKIDGKTIPVRRVQKDI